MDYFTIKIECTPEQLAAAETVLQLNMISGWVDEPSKNSDTLTFYLPKDEAGRGQLEKIQAELKQYGISTDEGLLKGEDWEKYWKRSFKTMVLNKIVLCPPWEEYEPKSDEKMIRIEPGMAFGTGDHATTAQTMLLLQKYLKAADHMLDLGTGSGVLAMAAALLGAEPTGIDNDPIAVNEANENLVKNGLQDRVKITGGDALKELDGSYDLICANLFLNQVLKILQSGVPYLKDSGIFIGSGITGDQKSELIEGMKSSNFEIIEILERNNWIAFAARKK